MEMVKKLNDELLRMKKDVIWSPDGPKRAPQTASKCFGKKLGQNGGPMGVIGRRGGFPDGTFPIRKMTFLMFSQSWKNKS